MKNDVGDDVWGTVARAWPEVEVSTLIVAYTAHSGDHRHRDVLGEALQARSKPK